MPYSEKIELDTKTHANLKRLQTELCVQGSEIVTLDETIQCLLQGKQSWLAGRKATR